jgi:hypothetical protein
LAFSLFELARHPDLQERVVQELNEVFGNDDRTPSLSDLNRLKYLEQCIKETLRLYPSVPLVFRTLTEDAKLGTAACICSGFLYLIAECQVYDFPLLELIPSQINRVYTSCLVCLRFGLVLSFRFLIERLGCLYHSHSSTKTLYALPCLSHTSMFQESSLQFFLYLNFTQ